MTSIRYPYKCDCGKTFDVIKSMAECSTPESCECGKIANRIFTAPMTINPKSFKADYYHSLGKVITNERELKNELAKRDLVPIGNDYGSGTKMVEHFDSRREEEREKKWDKILDKVEL